MSFLNNVKKSFSVALKLTLESIIDQLEKDESLGASPPLKEDIVGNVYTEDGKLLLSNNVDVNDLSTYGIIQQNLKEKGDEIKQLQDLVDVPTKTFNGNALTATTASSCSGNAATATTAASLVPSESAQITGNFGGDNSAVLVFKTGDRGYTWRMRFRGNGAGAEAYLEYLNCDNVWTVGQFSPPGSIIAYKDALGGDSCK
jgi:hypothetical protein